MEKYRAYSKDKRAGETNRMVSMVIEYIKYPKKDSRGDEYGTGKYSDI